jgi:N-methylhydantoinase A
LGIANVLVPPSPGLLCAHGLLVADMRADFSVTRIGGLEETGAAGLNAAFAELRELATAWFDKEAIPPDRRWMDHAVDMRYRGQSHELTVLAGDGDSDEAGLAALAEGFHREHERVYSYAPRGRVQIVTYRITASTPIGGSTPAIAAVAPGDTAVGPMGIRRGYFPALSGFVDCPVYDRARLALDAEITGPAIIEQMDTTTVVLPRQTARAGSTGSLLLSF